MPSFLNAFEARSKAFSAYFAAFAAAFAASFAASAVIFATATAAVIASDCAWVIVPLITRAASTETSIFESSLEQLPA